MFSKDEKTQKENDTIIGLAVKVRGDFQGKGNIVIEGELEGSLKTEGALFAGEKSIIIADIEAEEAKILGQVRGNIKLNGFLEIGAGAKIEGDIIAKHLAVAKGAAISGLIKITPSKDFPKEEKKTNNEQTDEIF